MQLGIYGGAVKLAMIMALITQAFRYAYEPFVFAAAKKGESTDNRATYALTMKYFLIFTLFAFLMVIAYIDLFKHMMGRDYWDGLKTVAIVMVGEIIKGVYFNLSFWYKLTDRTIWGAWFSGAGCLVLVACNLLFVPRFGYMACAWSGVIGYTVAMLLSYFTGQKYYPIAYPLKRIFAYVALTAVLYAAMTISRDSSRATSCASPSTRSASSFSSLSPCAWTSPCPRCPWSVSISANKTLRCSHRFLRLCTPPHSTTAFASFFQPSESEVVYCGYVICAGTRHEAPEDSGMAHFIEHMSFKGTQRRKSRQINDYLERVGGELNAFTSKQETVYCATVLRRDVHRAVDILTDMVFHSVYPQNEIEKEVEVIIDEIDSYKDSPSELIFDEFEQLLFGDTSLGRDILGDKNRLRSYTTADALRFTGEHYRPDNAVFYLTAKWIGRSCFGASRKPTPPLP